MSEKQWKSVEAGPIQMKKVEKAFRDIRWLAKTTKSLTGIKGIDEDESYSQILFAPPTFQMPLDKLDEIMDKYDCRITRQNYKDIIDDIRNAITECKPHIPVKDTRRTPEEEAERIKSIQDSGAKRREEDEKVNANNAAIIAKKPANAAALIVAILEKDDCESQSDYWGTKEQRHVAIGWRTGSREDFRQLRAAAAKFPETADLAHKECEHRDNYSMGRGNYLKKARRYGTGWYVQTRSLPLSASYCYEDALPVDDEPPEGTNEGTSVKGDGFTVRPGTREGFVEVLLPGKPAPDDPCYLALKAARFRFTSKGGVKRWYGKEDRLPERFLVKREIIAEKVNEPPPDVNKPEPKRESQGEKYPHKRNLEDVKPTRGIETLTEDDCKYVTDGKLLALRSAMKGKKLDKDEGRPTVSEEQATRVVEKAKGIKTRPAKIAGTFQVTEDCIETVLVADNGDYAAVNSEILRWLQGHVRFTRMEITPRPKAPVKFYDKEEFVGLLMPLKISSEDHEYDKLAKDFLAKPEPKEEKVIPITQGKEIQEEKSNSNLRDSAQRALDAIARYKAARAKEVIRIV